MLAERILHMYVCPDLEREYISLINQVEKVIILSSIFFIKIMSK